MSCRKQQGGEGHMNWGQYSFNRKYYTCMPLIYVSGKICQNWASVYYGFYWFSSCPPPQKHCSVVFAHYNRFSQKSNTPLMNPLA